MRRLYLTIWIDIKLGLISLIWIFWTFPSQPQSCLSHLSAINWPVWANNVKQRRKMSQIRKSASFRSRIPIRRAVPRRCYSPEPHRNQSTRAMYEQNHNDFDVQPYNHGEQRISKQKMKRQRHVATTLAQHNMAKANHDPSASNFAAATRPKTIYSSSSFSSSDESQESEAPPQVRLILPVIRSANRNRVSLHWIYGGLLSNEIRTDREKVIELRPECGDL